MPKNTSKLLINEPTLQALPSLACLVGINGAIILQQVHWWSNISEHRMNGFIWVYNSYEDWCKQFKWLTPRALQKHILQLEKDGYLISESFPYRGKGRTKWYRVDYEHLDIQCENIHHDGENILINGEKSNNECENIHHDDTLFSHKASVSQSPKNTKEYHRIPEIEELQKLPYWKNEDEVDLDWFNEFKIDFPNFGINNIKSCRDYWDGKKTKHKGQWKSRLRNWMMRESNYKKGQTSFALPNQDDLVAQAKERGLIE